jgi:hypothetical protein
LNKKKEEEQNIREIHLNFAISKLLKNLASGVLVVSGAVFGHLNPTVNFQQTIQTNEQKKTEERTGSQNERSMSRRERERRGKG